MSTPLYCCILFEQSGEIDRVYPSLPLYMMAYDDIPFPAIFGGKSVGSSQGFSIPMSPDDFSPKSLRQVVAPPLVGRGARNPRCEIFGFREVGPLEVSIVMGDAQNWMLSWKSPIENSDLEGTGLQMETSI